MKKTLVALAVLAASGASFAQATITGSYAFGYASSVGTTHDSGALVAASTTGIGTDTADINFAATENLGGGMSATAKMGISGADRGTGVKGNTATLGIKTASFGVTMGRVESANGLLGIGSSGASGFGLDGKVITGSSDIDSFGLTVPLSSSLTMGVGYSDRDGLTKGTTGAAAAQPSVAISLTYGAGAIAAKGDYTTWTRQDEVAAFTSKSRIRLSGAYDLGVARLSAGYSQLDRTSSITSRETLLGLKVPMGAVTVGVDYAVMSVTGKDDNSGYSLGVGYDLSKRTNIGASFANYKARNFTGNAVATENANLFRVLVAHNF